MKGYGLKLEVSISIHYVEFEGNGQFMNKSQIIYMTVLVKLSGCTMSCALCYCPKVIWNRIWIVLAEYVY